MPRGGKLDAKLDVKQHVKKRYEKSSHSHPVPLPGPRGFFPLIAYYVLHYHLGSSRQIQFQGVCRWVGGGQNFSKGVDKVNHDSIAKAQPGPAQDFSAPQMVYQMLPPHVPVTSLTTPLHSV